MSAENIWSVYENCELLLENASAKRKEDTSFNSSHLIYKCSEMDSPKAEKKQACDPATPPPLPVKVKREQFAALKMNSINSDLGFSSGSSNSSLSQDLGSPPPKADPSSAAEDSDVFEIDPNTYVNIGLVRSQIQPVKNPRKVATKERTFSEVKLDDCQPPPLPQKKLIRTHSLPLGKWIGMQYDNLTYGVMKGEQGFYAPIHKEANNMEICTSTQNFREQHMVQKKISTSYSFDCGLSDSPKNMSEISSAAVPSQFSLPYLNFSTPDEHLIAYFKDFGDKDEVFQKMNECRWHFLHEMTLKLRDSLSTENKSNVDLSRKKWSDFKVLNGAPSCEAGDAFYYNIDCISCFANSITAKVYKEKPVQELPIQKDMKPHFNIQQICNYFSNIVIGQHEPSEKSVSHEALREDCFGREGLDIASNGHTSGEKETVTTHNVAISPVAPYKTLAEFVKESEDFHMSEPDTYQRHVCLLLLQLCSGIQHLKSQNIAHCNLKLENLLLVNSIVHKDGEQENNGESKKPLLPRLIISNFSKAKHMSTADPVKTSRLAPELLPTSQYKMADEFQVGILIYELLHLPNPFEKLSKLRLEEYQVQELPQIQRQSVYSQGLQLLVQHLLHNDPHKRIHINQAKHILDALLWGPRMPLTKEQPTSYLLIQHWLEIKRTLLVLKFANTIMDTGSMLGLEDWFCCQYFTFATADTIYNSVKFLQKL
ncbi:protein PEAK3 [Protopterus annectens]|uniref:protein PEAK3 n=1 Tax=Protopterus annectens TaxID=7888 RepID=UPI001CF93C0D|nr:protein PEAK3 [Protopterus annectens]